MDTKIEDCIQKNIQWNDLTVELKKALTSKTHYEKRVVDYSIKNQLRFRGNLIRLIGLNEKSYYKELLEYSSNHLMLFPYHLSDYIVAGMRITPFQYYIKIIQDLLYKEKSYDTLPNFTAADCLRLLGIGRNQYLDLMNQKRESTNIFYMMKKVIAGLLPSSPVEDLVIEPWWIVNPGYITEDDIKYCTTKIEKDVIDKLVSEVHATNPLKAGNIEQSIVRKLYLKGLVYFDVPIEDDDLIIVPPLEGFVMNRVTGDYFETLLYKIFISIDQKTTVIELAEMLNIKLNLVKMAISMYCRLGFAYKKEFLNYLDYNLSWKDYIVNSKYVKTSKENLMDDSQLIKFIESAGVYPDEFFDECISSNINDTSDNSLKSPTSSFSNSMVFTNTSFYKNPIQRENSLTSSFMNINHNKKRIALLYDSTLAAFLMMGNLSPNLKTHAVTMFEAGKLIDESLDSLLFELNQIKDSNLDEQGFEAEKYFLHAILLCKTIMFLRNNPKLNPENNQNLNDSFNGLGLDLIRCESLLNLEEEISQKFLHKNYSLLFSLCPLSNETKIINTFSINYGVPHFGSSSSLLNSVWFKLFLYEKTKFGPSSLFLTKGYRLTVFPIEIFGCFDNLLLTPLNKDSLVISVGNALEVINDYLLYSPVLVQGYSNSNLYFNANSSNNSYNNSNDDEITNELKDIIYVPLPLNDENFSSKNEIIENKDLSIENNEEKSTIQDNNQNTESVQNENTKINQKENIVNLLDLKHQALMRDHPAIQRLNKLLCLDSLCGFVRLIQHTSFNTIDETFNSTLNSDLSDEEYLNKEKYKEMKDDFANWTLLDCYFGIPLFDRKLNKLVCDNIEKANLCTQENLEKTLKINTKLNNCLQHFVNYYINEFPYKNKADKEWISNQVLAVKKDDHIPFPTCNLIFYNGKISKFI